MEQAVKQLFSDMQDSPTLRVRNKEALRIVIHKEKNK